MRYRQLGSTGMYISELGLGTMTFGGGKEGIFSHFGAQDQAQADAMVRAAYDAGVNYFDTANIYNNGQSEDVLGRALSNAGIPRDQAIIGSKVFGLMDEKQKNPLQAPNDSGLSRRHIMNAVEETLKRLNTDYLDLYQAHGFDPDCPLEETLRAFDDLITAGKVRYIGCSNWAAWNVVEALGISSLNGFHRLESVQAYYSLAGRGVERELVPAMDRHGLSMLVWSPLASGFLTGKYDQTGRLIGKGEAARRAAFNFPPVDMERGYTINEIMKPMAASRGISVAQIALAWLLHQPVVTSVIVGARKIEQLEDNLGAAGVTLTEEELKALDKASELPLEYPGWMVKWQAARHLSWRKGLPPDPTPPSQ